MFEAKLSDGYIFKKIIESVKDIVDIANFNISSQGLQVQAMDSSHVALVSLKLSKEGFETYRCDSPQVLGINIKEFSKFMKFIEPNDTILLKCDKNASSLYVQSVS